MRCYHIHFCITYLMFLLSPSSTVGTNRAPGGEGGVATPSSHGGKCGVSRGRGGGGGGRSRGGWRGGQHGLHPSPQKKSCQGNQGCKYPCYPIFTLFTLLIAIMTPMSFLTHSLLCFYLPAC